MPRTQKAAWCLCISSLVLAAPLAAQEDYSNRIGVELGAGAGKYSGGNLDHSDIGPLFHGGVRLGWKRNMDLLLGVRYGTFAASGLPDSLTSGGDNLGRTFHNHSTQIAASLLYSFNPEARWTPVVFGGAGVTFWEVVDLTGQSSGLFADGPVPVGFNELGGRDFLSDENWTLHFGGGADVDLARRIGLHARGRVDWLIDQNKDNTGASAAFGNAAHVDANEFQASIFVGLHYFFSDRDSDRDGIANRSDACPYEAEDIDATQDQDGCPDLDNDGDGVADKSDKAPDLAEDKDGFQDEDGAPDPDNDGDAVADADDKCPDGAEDKDGFQDEDGCPDVDNDGDGIADAKDTCADTPQGVPVDSLGCPTVAAIDGERVLASVRFRAGSAEIEPAGFAALDSVAQSLKAYPGVEIEVQAHTSDIGANADNQALSQRRAEAVVAHLVSRGIARTRLTAIGYGEESPLVANDTPGNRARNERVTIVPMQAPVLEPAQPEKKP